MRSTGCPRTRLSGLPSGSSAGPVPARVPSAPPGVRRVRRALPAVAAALALTLTGCSGGGGGAAAGNGGAGNGGDGESPSAPPSNYLDVPRSVTLTPQGTELDLGQSAVVAWQLGAKKIAAVDLTVTKVEKASLKVFKAWKLPKSSLGSTPYFVHAKVRNVGKADLSEISMPVYLLVRGKPTLVAASTFQSLFKPCPSTPLPAKFKRGKKASICLVFLAPEQAELGAISFYTGPGFDALTWNGPAVAYRPAGDGKPGKQRTKKGQRKRQQNEAAN